MPCSELPQYTPRITQYETKMSHRSTSPAIQAWLPFFKKTEDISAPSFLYASSYLNSFTFPNLLKIHELSDSWVNWHLFCFSMPTVGSSTSIKISIKEGENHCGAKRIIIFKRNKMDSKNKHETLLKT